MQSNISVISAKLSQLHQLYENYQIKYNTNTNHIDAINLLQDTAQINFRQTANTVLANHMVELWIRIHNLTKLYNYIRSDETIANLMICGIDDTIDKYTGILVNQPDIKPVAKRIIGFDLKSNIYGAIVNLPAFIMFSLIAKRVVRFNYASIVILPLSFGISKYCYNKMRAFIKNKENEWVKNLVLADPNSMPKYIAYLCKEDLLMHILIAKPTYINYAEDYSTDVCTQVIGLFPLLIKYVKNQRYEYCKAAVENYGSCISHIKNQTDNLCMLAIINDVDSIRHIVNPSIHIAEFAVGCDVNAIKHIRSDIIDKSDVLRNIRETTMIRP